MGLRIELRGTGPEVLREVWMRLHRWMAASEVGRHVLAARREMLLAARSAIDSSIRTIDQAIEAAEKAKGPNEGGSEPRKVEVE